ncbi:MAG: hypothetical protein GF355_07135 [Candidatus Eisenbacteria bacterium]|nr:hypothetical protein [Candidatus Eisenbacteria bacterium]
MILLLLRWALIALLVGLIWKVVRGLWNVASGAGGGSQRVRDASRARVARPWDEKDVEDVGYEEVKDEEKAS